MATIRACRGPRARIARRSCSSLYRRVSASRAGSRRSCASRTTTNCRRRRAALPSGSCGRPLQLAAGEARAHRCGAHVLERLVDEQRLVAGDEVHLGQTIGEMALELAERNFQNDLRPTRLRVAGAAWLDPRAAGDPVANGIDELAAAGHERFRKRRIDDGIFAVLDAFCADQLVQRGELALRQQLERRARDRAANDVEQLAIQSYGLLPAARLRPVPDRTPTGPRGGSGRGASPPATRRGGPRIVRELPRHSSSRWAGSGTGAQAKATT